MLFLPVSLLLRNRFASLVFNTITNGLATFAATYVVKWICGWLGVQPTYAMFALPFIALMSNDMRRLHGAKTQAGFAGMELSNDSEGRKIVVTAERCNLWSDLIGFSVAIAMVSPIPTF